MERNQAYIPRPLVDVPGNFASTALRILRDRKIPSITAITRTAYINAIAPICTAAIGKSVSTSTTKMIGKKYSPTERRESTKFLTNRRAGPRSRAEVPLHHHEDMQLAELHEPLSIEALMLASDL